MKKTMAIIEHGRVFIKAATTKTKKAGGLSAHLKSKVRSGNAHWVTVKEGPLEGRHLLIDGPRPDSGSKSRGKILAGHGIPAHVIEKITGATHAHHLEHKQSEGPSRPNVDSKITPEEHGKIVGHLESRLTDLKSQVKRKRGENKESMQREIAQREKELENIKQNAPKQEPKAEPKKQDPLSSKIKTVANGGHAAFKDVGEAQSFMRQAEAKGHKFVARSVDGEWHVHNGNGSTESKPTEPKKQKLSKEHKTIQAHKDLANKLHTQGHLSHTEKRIIDERLSHAENRLDGAKHISDKERAASHKATAQREIDTVGDMLKEGNKHNERAGKAANKLEKLVNEYHAHAKANNDHFMHSEAVEARGHITHVRNQINSNKPINHWDLKDRINKLERMGKMFNSNRKFFKQKSEPVTIKPEEDTRVPKSSSGSTLDSHSPKAHIKLDELENKIRHNSSETGHIVTPDGRHIWSQKGGKDYVDVGDAARNGHLAGNILTHNHPSGSGFSLPDIAVLMAHGLKEIRAAGKHYNYRMQIPDGKRFSPAEVDAMKRDFNNIQDKVRRENWTKINNGELTPEEAGKHHHHAIWSKVAPKYGLKYGREKV